MMLLAPMMDSFMDEMTKIARQVDYNQVRPLTSGSPGGMGGTNRAVAPRVVRAPSSYSQSMGDIAREAEQAVTRKAVAPSGGLWAGIRKAFTSAKPVARTVARSAHF